MSPAEAITRFNDEVQKRPNLHIAAISGPGEPLANPETFETLREIRAIDGNIDFCLSTNGTLLANFVNELVDLRVRTISVSISTVNPDTATRIYEWVVHDGVKLTGKKMGLWITKQQLLGIQRAIENDLLLKANSILIPGINDTELESLAQSLSDIGIKLQNIIPLVPYANFINQCAPTPSELHSARERMARHLKQFKHCALCRSDVVGLPGADSIL
jgi:nitrogen fixation protein NifB